MVKERDFKNIKFKSYGISAKPYRIPKKKREVLGWDTETYEGKATLIANSKGEYLIIKSLNDLFPLLFKYRNYHNFFFNLTYDCNAIIKWFPESNQLDLIKRDFTFYKEFKIEIIANKLLKIKKTNLKTSHITNFYDIAHFYHIGSLEKTVKRVLNKEYIKRIQNREKGFNYEDITPEVIQYCIEDAVACYELAKNFVDLTEEIVYVPKYLSPASISKALLKTHLKEDYHFQPTKIQQYAMNSYQGGRFECFKKGYFEESYIYDINSAYPKEISELKTFKGLSFTNRGYKEDALHSFFKCNVYIPRDFIISPFKYEIPKRKTIVFPVGLFKKVFLTKEEYEQLTEWNCEIKILKALHILPTKLSEKNLHPFKWIKDLYSKRQELKKANNRLEHILKLALNSTYGIMIQLNKKKFISKNWKPEDELNLENELIDVNGKIKMVKHNWVAGGFFNPIWASEITANTRLTLLKNAYQNEDKIIMFATDSIISEKPLTLPISDNLGEWSGTPKMYGIVLGNGIYQFNDSGIYDKRAFRSFSKTLDLFHLLEENKERSELIIKKYKPFKLKESRTKLDKLNNFFYFQKKLNPNFDKKRLWLKNFSCFEDVLTEKIESNPLSSTETESYGEWIKNE